MRYFSILLAVVFSACTNTSKMNQDADQLKDQPTTSSSEYLFVGTYTKKEGHVDGKGKGIHILKWNSTDQSLSPHMVIDQPVNPSYIALHPTKSVVYCVNELADNTSDIVGTIQAYSYDLDKKSYQKISETSSMGDAPCHISVTADGLQVLVANYVGGSIATYSIREDGSVSNATAAYENIKSTPTTPRQEAGHAHMIRQLPNSNNIIVSDLGTDELLTFALSGNGAIEKKHVIKTVQYGGPRHFDFHPAATYLYSLNELIPSITVFELKADIPAITIQQLEIPIKKEGDPVYSSAIKVHPKGTTVYAATRGLNGTQQNEMVVCAIDSSGQLEIIQTISTKGQVPRDFTISPDNQYLIAGNQDSDEIAIYRIDPKNGKLTLISADQKIPTPVCFQWG